jgi:hypothetical protein
MDPDHGEYSIASLIGQLSHRRILPSAQALMLFALIALII